jgi:hypothetical protein
MPGDSVNALIAMGQAYRTGLAQNGFAERLIETGGAFIQVEVIWRAARLSVLAVLVGTKKAADISATFPSSHLPITSDNHNRMRDEQRAGSGDHNSRDIRRSMRERSRRNMLGRTHRNKQVHSRHSSRTPVRHNNRN